MSADAKSKFAGLLRFLLRLGIAGGLIFWLCYHHREEFQQAFPRIKPAFFALALAVYAAATAVGARRWQVILQLAGFPVRFGEAMELTMKGCFFALVIPGGAIGGDVAKLGFLAARTAQGARLEGALTILLDRIVGMAGLFLAALLLIVAELPIFLRVEIPGITLTPAGRIAIVLLPAAVCLAGLLSIPILLFLSRLRQIGWIDRSLAAADRISRGAVSRLTQVFELARRQWRTLLFWAVLSLFFVHGAQAAVVLCICAGLGLTLTVPVVMAVGAAVMIGNMAGLLPLSFSGLGVRDMVICLLLSAARLPDPAAVPLLYSVVLVLFNLAGGLFLLNGVGQTNSITRKHTL